MNINGDERVVLHFFVHQQPLSKKMGFSRSGNVVNYTSHKMKQFAAEAANHIPTDFNTNIGPVSLTVIAYFSRPCSDFKRQTRALSHLRRHAPTSYHFKPDCDNIAKFVGDALTGIAFKDDQQVCDLVIRKRWTASPIGYYEIKIEYQ